MSAEKLIYNPNQISLYLHWPFCLKKCPYCDFNSYVNNKETDFKLWEKAYLGNIEYQSKFIGDKYIKSVFFGGGTPSLMSPDLVNSIISKIIALNKGMPPKEITLEVNPSSFEIEKFKLFKEAGVGRVSIGVQSFSEQQLKYLGRIHSGNEALSAIKAANEIFDYVSFDLINGLKNQSLADWQKELEIAIPLIKSHISIYELTIEEGTAFYRQKQKAVHEDLAAQMMLYTIEKLSKYNIKPYEISNYSKPEHQSIHNLNYWRGGLFLGVGPGAHGRVLDGEQIIATTSHKNPNKWLDLANNNQQEVFTDYAIVDPAERMFELILSNLRLSEAISPLVINGVESSALQFLMAENLLELKDDKYYTTQDGKLKLNAIVTYLTEHIKL
ncbi:radical SAM family heme chaperone HemW [Rickettsiales bacterium LUAb2]